MKRLLWLCALCVSIYAEAVVIQGETSAGVYNNVLLDPSQYIYVDCAAGCSGVSTPTITPPTSPAATNSPTETTVSTAYEASHIVKASAGILYSLLCYNSNAAAQFILSFNSTTLPANATVSVTVPVTCPATSNCVLDFGVYGKYYSTGIVWSNSSTSPTKTIGSADVFCEPRYK